MSARPPRVLALSSGGGHWIELLRLRPAFAGAELHFASVSGDYRNDVADARFHRIPDATRWNKLALLWLLCCLCWLLLRVRPDVIVTTGAAPGYLAIRLGKLLRARTIWLDSIANVDELSLSGRMAGRHADLWLTQWPHLAKEHGPHCRGAVL